MARNFINQLLNRNQGPVLPVLQMDENGQFDPASVARVEMEQTPLTLRDRLLGRELTKDIIQTDPKSGETNMATISSVRSGLLPDLAKGYNENYNQGLNFNNFGQKKGWAERIGEGLGSVGRVIDSPLGRGLLAAGLNSALGYDNSLQEGLTAAVGRQNAQTADRIYRQQLAAQGIDTSNIGGNINSDIYRQILYGQQLQDNAAYRQLYLDNQQRQNEIMNQIRQDQLDRQKKQDEIQNQIAFGKLGIEGQRLNLEGQRVAAYMKSLENKANKTSEDKAILRQLSDNSSTLADIEAGLQLIEENPQAYTWFKGKVGADIANRLDPKGVPTRTQIDNITAVYRKWLTGAQMSDAERKAYERFLPAPTDNAQIVKSKLQGMKNSIERKNQILMQGAKINNTQDVDPLGIL